jgi:hypothetical protein
MSRLSLTPSAVRHPSRNAPGPAVGRPGASGTVIPSRSAKTSCTISGIRVRPCYGSSCSGRCRGSNFGTQTAAQMYWTRGCSCRGPAEGPVVTPMPSMTGPCPSRHRSQGWRRRGAITRLSRGRRCIGFDSCHCWLSPGTLTSAPTQVHEGGPIAGFQITTAVVLRIG